MMTIGISLGYNTSAAVVSENGVEFAISEERLIGEKNTKKFPINALKKCVEYVKDNELLDGPLYIGISSYEVINDRTLKYIPDDAERHRIESVGFKHFIKEYIRKECDIEHFFLIRTEHHTAHANPAEMMSGFHFEPEDFIVVTYDGFGDGVCGTIKNAKTNELLAREYTENSLGLVYQFVTGALGFKEHQHEGKITGLAAFGEPKYMDMFKNYLIDYDPDLLQFVPNYKKHNVEQTELTRTIDHNKNIHGFVDLMKLKESVYHFISHLQFAYDASDEDIAASVQEYTEELVTQWICDVLDENHIYGQNIALSGGLFANVKVNYHIKMETESKNLYVLPPMGDEGTAIGAAIEALYWRRGRIFTLENAIKFSKDNLYLGQTLGSQSLDLNDVDEKKYDIIQLCEVTTSEYVQIISEQLARGNIVCMSKGYSEFGPRALGNHSILYDAGEKETNDSLNEKLGRTEFMPFAPITITQFAKDLFSSTDGFEKSLKYMTVAVPVTDEFRENYKAAYHVDFTARPQILNREDNELLYLIISEYAQLTGKKALINTSFNLHNSPIIYDTKVAYDSFDKADLDVLVLDDVIIAKKGLI